MNKDAYRETGTVFHRTPFSTASGKSLSLAVRAVLADHQRLLRGPYQDAKAKGARYSGAAGKMRTQLPDGTLVTTWVNTFGLVPTLCASIQYPSGEEIVEEFACEAGLLTWDPLTPYLPLHVHLGDALKQQAHPKLISSDYHNSTYWTATRPDLEYPDYVNDFYVDRNYWPSLWSGKARLMMQALHAIKRDPKEIFGVNINSNYQGIWEAPGYRYFVVGIGAGGVFATKLVFQDDASDKAIQARAFLLDHPDDADKTQLLMAESCYLSALEVAGDPVEILTAGDMADVTAAGGAMAYGWKFARGKLEASIVTFREECMPEFVETTCIGQFVTSLYTITAEYSIAQDEWTCTISHPHGPIRTRPRTAITSIYKPLYGYPVWGMTGVVPGWGGNPFPACCYVQFEDNIAPYYCFYDVEDTLQIAWYVQYQDMTESHDTRPTDISCNIDFSWEAEWGSFGYRQGGFCVSENPPILADFQDNYHNYTVGSYSVTTEAGGTRIVYTHPTYGSENDLYYAASTMCGGEVVSAYNLSHSPYLPQPWPPEGMVGECKITATMGTTHEQLITQLFTATPRIWSLVISPHDSEAVYVFARGKIETVAETIVGTYDASDYDPPNTRSVFGGTFVFEFKNTLGQPMETFTLSTLARSQAPSAYLYGSWFGYVFNALSYGVGEGQNNGSISETPRINQFYSPHGTIELNSTAHVSSFFPDSILEGTFIDQQPMRTILAYSGDGMYYTEEGAPSMIGGFAAYPGLASFFIGGA